jgi:hypothetical protein
MHNIILTGNDILAPARPHSFNSAGVEGRTNPGAGMSVKSEIVVRMLIE